MYIEITEEELYELLTDEEKEEDIEFRKRLEDELASLTDKEKKKYSKILKRASRKTKARFIKKQPKMWVDVWKRI
ncbi:hypothetical protein [Bacillus sp. 1P02SD]|uniref:hypothetical protein n=1 Tax=Bacillus sp. 1P02SD TaxID=3132264 RepID=UPI0039A2E1B2